MDHLNLEQLKQLTIEKPDYEIAAKVKEIWNNVIKPIDSMGEFESLLCKIGAIAKTSNISLSKKAVIVMCADNGIAEEGVSKAPQEVTALIAASMAKRQSCVCRMAQYVNAQMKVVDIGINADMQNHDLIHRKIGYGTKNFANCPAMTEAEAWQAIQVGVELMKHCKDEGYEIVAMGEMGIGNTTTSSAVAAALLDCSVEAVTGAGSGLSLPHVKLKQELIQRALNHYQFQPAETLRILASVGGYDIAGLAGVCIGGALYGIPVVVDGVISAAAALVAQRLVPGVKEFLIPSHMSREPAAELILRELGLQPLLHADMALGEGTGAVMMLSLLDMALAVYTSQVSLDQLGIILKPDFQEEPA